MKKILYIMLLFPFLGIAQDKGWVPVKVEVRTDSAGAFTLYRGGEPYYIKGGGGKGNMDILVRSGGNSVRTWSIDGAEKVLDEAHARGLTVMMGLWMGHERHGFDYNDEYSVKDQLRRFRKAVRKLKNHPALLLWGVGNEVNLMYSNYNVWEAVGDIAKMIHEEDPNHPTACVTAGIDVAEVQMIMAEAPHIDILAANTYGDIEGLSQRVRLYGWDKPYIVTEWGPNGHWESPNTPWGAPIEQTSSSKADSYKERYRLITDDKKKCLGAYAFLWGNKQETTATWYGLLLASGEKTEAVDRLSKAWSGKYPENRSPAFKSLHIGNKRHPETVYLEQGKTYPVQATFEDVENDQLRIVWEVLPESTSTKAGGDWEETLNALENLIIQAKDTDPNAQLIAPERSGAYRLFVYAFDGNGNAGYANYPFYVK